MTALLQRDELLTAEEYLASEAESPQKREYLAGVVYATAGATEQHNTIAMNLAFAFMSRLRENRCRPYGSDMKVRMRRPGADFFYYPDLSIACDPIPPEQHWYETPVLVVEIASASSERTDHGEKRLNYLQIATLGAFVILEQESVAATVWRRVGEEWSYEVLRGKEAVLRLPFIDCTVPLAELYERTGF
jgi:Uma2 family endonuclease